MSDLELLSKLSRKIVELEALLAEATVREEDHAEHDGAYWKALRDAQALLQAHAKELED